MTDFGAREVVGVREASLVLGLPPDLAAIGAARRRVGAFLELSALETEDAESVLLVTSELCTNAVRATSGEAEVVVGCRLGGGAVEVEVINPGNSFRHPTGAMPPPEAESGRGLAIVETLTDQLQVRNRAGRTSVRAVRRLASRRSSAAEPPAAPRFRRRW
jgi:serine/threonine-protein kinase RsbW